MKKARSWSLFAVASLAALPACAGGAGDGLGSLILRATDAPLEFSQVTQAEIGITTINVHRRAGGDSGFTTIYDGPAIALDLVDLRNGITQILVDAALPAGSYDQVRLVFGEANLTLENANHYSSDDGTLSLSSQSTSGLKFHIRPPIEIVDGLSSTLLLDFDLAKTFKPESGSDPLNAEGYKVHPVIRTANATTSGEIRGVVTQDDGAGMQVGVESATVHVLPPGETDPASAVAMTATDMDGSYAVLGLPEGTYDVMAGLEELGARVDGRVVSAGNFTVVDLILQ
jgi:hypothetical protein